MEIKDIVARDALTTVLPEATIRDAAALMTETGSSSILVCTADRKPVGFVSDADIVASVAAEASPVDSTVDEIMTPAGDPCSEHEDVHDVAGRMRNDRINIVPVIDRNRKAVGMIGLSQLTQLPDLKR